MKKFTLVLAAVLFAVTGLLAQSPNEFKYQAALRDAGGLIMASEAVTVDISVLQGSASGTSVFDETHSVTTTAQGLINLNIGSVADMSTVDFSSGTYFIEISVNGTTMGASQLLSVPYALYATTSGSSIPGPQGETGLQGADGIDGLPGADGAAGNDGLPGADGNDGLPGADGNDGLPGADGNAGLPGADGNDGLPGADGNAGLPGADGNDGLPGADGNDGLPGADGNDGLPGADGAGFTDGTNSGEMKYWDGTAWVQVAVSANEGAALQLIGGVPTWVGGTPPPTTITIGGNVWMDRNLGATNAATANGSTDPTTYGDLYQWGREADGHQLRTSSTTTTLSSTDSPGHADFILHGSSNWRSPDNINLWQGVDGINNPCPSGFRLPTSAELDTDINNPLFLNSRAGHRVGSDGTIGFEGSGGRYWSSTTLPNSGPGGVVNNSSIFNTANLNPEGLLGVPRMTGASVRCILD